MHHLHAADSKLVMMLLGKYRSMPLSPLSAVLFKFKKPAFHIWIQPQSIWSFLLIGATTCILCPKPALIASTKCVAVTQARANHDEHDPARWVVDFPNRHVTRARIRSRASPPPHHRASFPRVSPVSCHLVRRSGIALIDTRGGASPITRLRTFPSSES